MLNPQEVELLVAVTVKSLKLMAIFLPSRMLLNGSVPKKQKEAKETRKIPTGCRRVLLSQMFGG